MHRFKLLAAFAFAVWLGGAANDVAAQETQADEEITVTGTRERQALAETPVSIGAVKGETIAQDKPAHPSEVMGQIAGVGVAVTNGEGHTTAIRQPFTTNPVYLYLEDGVPTRSTGFFNHNALYEIDLPQAGGIEVIRGPGTALYGSDAIAGVVNVLTRTPPGQGEFYVSGEAGGWGWRRALLGGGDASRDDAWRADLNLTHADGWRDSTGYDRQSGIARWDRALGDDAMLKTVLGFSRIDQQTGANSPLVRADYENAPTLNYLPIAYRKVSALRLNTTYTRQDGDTLLSVTPYLRDNGMDLLASYTLSYDPTLASTHNKSIGLMTKWRRDYAALRARLIAGLDLDYSPGERLENRVVTTPSGSGASLVFSSYAMGPVLYDYRVAFRGVSPYVHGEVSPSERLRLTAGLRYDHLSYVFDNRLDVPVVTATAGFPGTRYYGQAGDTTVSFAHASPKLGATYALGAATHLYTSYNHGFRVPSEANLFRPSAATSAAAAAESAQTALALKPIRAQQFEIGLRGRLGEASYDVAVYELVKRDDILSLRDPVTNATQAVNAGKTRHRGVEIGAGAPFAARWRIDAALSYAKHEYVEWLSSQGDFSGKTMESAPRVLANTRLTWTPGPGTRVQLEWLHLGRYWLDAANSANYEGHDLYTLRANRAMGRGISLFGSVHNLANARYADSASLSSGTPVYSPGLPRTFYAGLEAKW